MSTLRFEPEREFFCACSKSISSYSLTSSFSCIQAEKQPFAGFLFALFGNSFEPCRNLDLEFCMAVMENPCCFQVFPLSLILSAIGPLKSAFTVCFIILPITFILRVIDPSLNSISILQTPNPSSISILAQLTNIYLA